VGVRNPVRRRLLRKLGLFAPVHDPDPARVVTELVAAESIVYLSSRPPLAAPIGQRLVGHPVGSLQTR
jgi:hypothetical protein